MWSIHIAMVNMDLYCIVLYCIYGGVVYVCEFEMYYFMCDVYVAEREDKVAGRRFGSRRRQK